MTDQPMTKSEVIHYAAHLFNLKPGDILADKRFANIHRARLALYMGFWERSRLAGREPCYSAIARVMRRDHSTVIHGMRRARYLMERDAEFLYIVHKITTATVADLPQPAPQPKQEAPCNLELHTLEALYQQRERPMDNPEYTEQCINAALDRAGLKAIRVYWDGEITSREEPPCFDVYLKDDETGVYVTDNGRDFDVTRKCEDRVHRPVGDARTFAQLVSILEEEFLSVDKEAA